MSNLLTIAQIGMTNDIQQLNLISHNLANATTAGFKREIAVAKGFENYLPLQASSQIGPASGSAPNIENHIDHSTGTMKFTGNRLDLGIESEGYFEVLGPTGIGYTRKGDLQIDSSGRLVTANGLVVNGMNGEIRVTTPDPFIDQQGVVWEGEQSVGQIKIVKFADKSAMEKLGEGLYQAEGGMVVNPDEVKIRQGYIETSNVVTMNEMVKMISVMRHFEASQKIIKGYDDMMDTAIKTIGEL